MTAISQGQAYRIDQLLSRLGTPVDFAGTQAKQLAESNPSKLRTLYTGFTEALGGPGDVRFQQFMQDEERRLPPAGFNRPPQRVFSSVEEIAGAGYAKPVGADVGIDDIDANFQRFLQPRHREGAKIGRLLATNPETRERFEARIGGRIIPGGDLGTIRVQRNPLAVTILPEGLSGASGQSTSALTAGNRSGDTIASTLAGMDAAILEQAQRIATLEAQGTARTKTGQFTPSRQPFNDFVSLGLERATGFSESETHSSALTSSHNLAGERVANSPARPGIINNTHPQDERDHVAGIDAVLKDPTLMVEDKVTLMLMMISQKADDDILRQSEYINAAQQQQVPVNQGSEQQSSQLTSMIPLFQGSGGNGIANHALQASIDARRSGTRRSGLHADEPRSFPIADDVPGVSSFSLAATSEEDSEDPNDRRRRVQLERGNNSEGLTQGMFGTGRTGMQQTASQIPGSGPSIDVETMKLKRMIDKRNQMFDMLRSIIDKYNETAKNTIQAIGR